MLIGLGSALAIANSKGIFAQTSPQTVYHILTDSFLVPGVVIGGLGLLIFASNEGTFDGLVFGMNSFFDIFRRPERRRHKTLYDYRAERADKKIQFGFMLICGLILTAVAVVMYLLYKQHV